jgi:DNA primase
MPFGSHVANDTALLRISTTNQDQGIAQVHDVGLDLALDVTERNAKLLRKKNNNGRTSPAIFTHPLLGLPLTLAIVMSFTICSSFLIGLVMTFQPIPQIILLQRRQQQHSRLSIQLDNYNVECCRTYFKRRNLATLLHDVSKLRSRTIVSVLFMQPAMDVSVDMISDIDHQIATNDMDSRASIELDGSDQTQWTNTTHRREEATSNVGRVLYQQNSQHTQQYFKDQIQKCKESVNIITVVESYGLDQFRRTSTDRAMAICPFHEDRHPSLHIDATKQIYKCFACNAGGDVIHFVQEYSKLPIHKSTPELSFLQALQHVNHNFGDGTITFTTSNHTSTKSQDSAVIVHKKERMMLANAYAALYFTNSLKELYAGGARHYLRCRGISIPTIKTMMIGFAPDVFYDNRFRQGQGPISLVNHLLQSGFTPQEILNSGLAVISKTRADSSASVSNVAFSSSNSFNDTGHNDTAVEEVDLIDPSYLMDRFRNRVMVPILDEVGSNILGFGGRIISSPIADETQSQSGSSFKAAKYLNSPESLIFEKRKLLFNQHSAQMVIQTSSGNDPPLLFVEGYMDVISLLEIGINNVVASMGTAISPKQLDQASKIAGFRSGKIVLCLDNDVAGTDAIERLCQNGMLEECARKNLASVHVARLPKETKDPANFIEQRRLLGMSSKEIAADFNDRVIAAAVDWKEWFIHNLITAYTQDSPQGSRCSFSDVFDKIAEFLANSFKPAERTKRAYIVAGELSSILASEQNATEISLSVRIQLESDLVDLASRKSAAKAVLQRRIDDTAIDTSPTTIPPTVALFARGYGPNSIDQDNQLSKSATRTKNRGTVSVKPLDHSVQKEHNDTSIFSSAPISGANSQRQVQLTRAKITRRREPDHVSVTTHFSGFQFKHQSDMEWLGLRNNKVSNHSLQYIFTL